MYTSEHATRVLPRPGSIHDPHLSTYSQTVPSASSSSTAAPKRMLGAHNLSRRTRPGTVPSVALSAAPSATSTLASTVPQPPSQPERTQPHARVVRTPADAVAPRIEGPRHGPGGATTAAAHTPTTAAVAVTRIRPLAHRTLFTAADETTRVVAGSPTATAAAAAHAEQTISPAFIFAAAPENDFAHADRKANGHLDHDTAQRTHRASTTALMGESSSPHSPPPPLRRASQLTAAPLEKGSSQWAERVSQPGLAYYTAASHIPSPPDHTTLNGGAHVDQRLVLADEPQEALSHSQRHHHDGRASTKRGSADAPSARKHKSAADAVRRDRSARRKHNSGHNQRNTRTERRTKESNHARQGRQHTSRSAGTEDRSDRSSSSAMSSSTANTSSGSSSSRSYYYTYVYEDEEGNLIAFSDSDMASASSAAASSSTSSAVSSWASSESRHRPSHRQTKSRSHSRRRRHHRRSDARQHQKTSCTILDTSGQRTNKGAGSHRRRDHSRGEACADTQTRAAHRHRAHPRRTPAVHSASSSSPSSPAFVTPHATTNRAAASSQMKKGRDARQAPTRETSIPFSVSSDIWYMADLSQLEREKLISALRSAMGSHHRLPPSGTDSFSTATSALNSTAATSTAAGWVPASLFYRLARGVVANKAALKTLLVACAGVLTTPASVCASPITITPTTEVVSEGYAQQQAQEQQPHVYLPDMLPFLVQGQDLPASLETIAARGSTRTPDRRPQRSLNAADGGFVGDSVLDADDAGSDALAPRVPSLSPHERQRSVSQPYFPVFVLAGARCCRLAPSGAIVAIGSPASPQRPPSTSPPAVTSGDGPCDRVWLLLADDLVRAMPTFPLSLLFGVNPNGETGCTPAASAVPYWQSWDRTPDLVRAQPFDTIWSIISLYRFAVLMHLWQRTPFAALDVLTSYRSDTEASGAQLTVLPTSSESRVVPASVPFRHNSTMTTTGVATGHVHVYDTRSGVQIRPAWGTGAVNPDVDHAPRAQGRQSYHTLPYSARPEEMTGSHSMPLFATTSTGLTCSGSMIGARYGYSPVQPQASRPTRPQSATGAPHRYSLTPSTSSSASEVMRVAPSSGEMVRASTTVVSPTSGVGGGAGAVTISPLGIASTPSFSPSAGPPTSPLSSSAVVLGTGATYHPYGASEADQMRARYYTSRPHHRATSAAPPPAPQVAVAAPVSSTPGRGVAPWPSAPSVAVHTAVDVGTNTSVGDFTAPSSPEAVSSPVLWRDGLHSEAHRGHAHKPRPPQKRRADAGVPALSLDSNGRLAVVPAPGSPTPLASPVFGGSTPATSTTTTATTDCSFSDHVLTLTADATTATSLANFDRPQQTAASHPQAHRTSQRRALTEGAGSGRASPTSTDILHGGGRDSDPNPKVAMAISATTSSPLSFANRKAKSKTSRHVQTSTSSSVSPSTSVSVGESFDTGGHRKREPMPHKTRESSAGSTRAHRDTETPLSGRETSAKRSAGVIVSSTGSSTSTAAKHATVTHSPSASATVATKLTCTSSEESVSEWGQLPPPPTYEEAMWLSTAATVPKPPPSSMIAHSLSRTHSFAAAAPTSGGRSRVKNTPITPPSPTRVHTAKRAAKDDSQQPLSTTPSGSSYLARSDEVNASVSARGAGGAPVTDTREVSDHGAARTQGASVTKTESSRATTDSTLASSVGLGGGDRHDVTPFSSQRRSQARRSRQQASLSSVDRTTPVPVWLPSKEATGHHNHGAPSSWLSSTGSRGSKEASDAAASAKEKGPISAETTGGTKSVTVGDAKVLLMGKDDCGGVRVLFGPCTSTAAQTEATRTKTVEAPESHSADDHGDDADVDAARVAGAHHPRAPRRTRPVRSSHQLSGSSKLAHTVSTGPLTADVFSQETPSSPDMLRNRTSSTVSSTTHLCAPTVQSAERDDHSVNLADSSTQTARSPSSHQTQPQKLQHSSQDGGDCPVSPKAEYSTDYHLPPYLLDACATILQAVARSYQARRALGSKMKRQGRGRPPIGQTHPEWPTVTGTQDEYEKSHSHATEAARIPRVPELIYPTSPLDSVPTLDIAILTENSNSGSGGAGGGSSAKDTTEEGEERDPGKAHGDDAARVDARIRAQEKEHMDGDGPQLSLTSPLKPPVPSQMLPPPLMAFARPADPKTATTSQSSATMDSSQRLQPPAVIRPPELRLARPPGPDEDAIAIVTSAVTTTKEDALHSKSSKSAPGGEGADADARTLSATSSTVAGVTATPATAGNHQRLISSVPQLDEHRSPSKSMTSAMRLLLNSLRARGVDALANTSGSDGANVLRLTSSSHTTLLGDRSLHTHTVGDSTEDAFAIETDSFFIDGIYTLADSGTAVYIDRERDLINTVQSASTGAAIASPACSENSPQGHQQGRATGKSNDNPDRIDFRGSVKASRWAIAYIQTLGRGYLVRRQMAAQHRERYEEQALDLRLRQLMQQPSPATVGVGVVPAHEPQPIVAAHLGSALTPDATAPPAALSSDIVHGVKAVQGAPASAGPDLAEAVPPPLLTAHFSMDSNPSTSLAGFDVESISHVTNPGLMTPPTCIDNLPFYIRQQQVYFPRPPWMEVPVGDDDDLDHLLLRTPHADRPFPTTPALLLPGETVDADAAPLSAGTAHALVNKNESDAKEDKTDDNHGILSTLPCHAKPDESTPVDVRPSVLCPVETPVSLLPMPPHPPPQPVATSAYPTSPLKLSAPAASAEDGGVHATFDAPAKDPRLIATLPEDAARAAQLLVANAGAPSRTAMAANPLTSPPQNPSRSVTTTWTTYTFSAPTASGNHTFSFTTDNNSLSSPVSAMAFAPFLVSGDVGGGLPQSVTPALASANHPPASELPQSSQPARHPPLSQPFLEPPDGATTPLEDSRKLDHMLAMLMHAQPAGHPPHPSTSTSVTALCTKATSETTAPPLSPSDAESKVRSGEPQWNAFTAAMAGGRSTSSGGGPIGSSTSSTTSASGSFGSRVATMPAHTAFTSPPSQIHAATESGNGDTAGGPFSPSVAPDTANGSGHNAGYPISLANRTRTSASSGASGSSSRAPLPPLFPPAPPPGTLPQCLGSFVSPNTVKPPIAFGAAVAAFDDWLVSPAPLPENAPRVYSPTSPHSGVMSTSSHSTHSASEEGSVSPQSPHQGPRMTAAAGASVSGMENSVFRSMRSAAGSMTYSLPFSFSTTGRSMMAGGLGNTINALAATSASLADIFNLGYSHNMDSASRRARARGAANDDDADLDEDEALMSNGNVVATDPHTQETARRQSETSNVVVVTDTSASKVPHKGDADAHPVKISPTTGASSSDKDKQDLSSSSSSSAPSNHSSSSSPTSSREDAWEDGAGGDQEDTAVERELRRAALVATMVNVNAADDAMLDQLGGLKLSAEKPPMTTAEACALLQRVGRGHLARAHQRFLLTLTVSAREVALLHRVATGYRVRKDVAIRHYVYRLATQNIQQWDRRNQAAIDMQRVARGFVARQQTKRYQRKLWTRVELRIVIEQPNPDDDD